MLKNNYLKYLNYFVLLVVGMACSIGAENLKPINTTLPKSRPELIIANGKSVADLFSSGIDAMGGFKSIKVEGKRVLIKPTICANNKEEVRLSTNSALITRIIAQLYLDGAWEVYVLDHTQGDWEANYKSSGIEKASKLAFGKILPVYENANYIDVLLSDSISFCKVHEIVEKCDIVINVAHLNFNPDSSVSAGIMNLNGLTWQSKNSIAALDKQSASILEICKPALTIIDASVVKFPNGEVKAFNKLIIGTDAVATDAMAFRLLNLDPEKIDYLIDAEKQKFGKLNADDVALQVIEL
jgi:uncharacterized protein (DUF362 family)